MISLARVAVGNRTNEPPGLLRGPRVASTHFDSPDLTESHTKGRQSVPRLPE